MKAKASKKKRRSNPTPITQTCRDCRFWYGVDCVFGECHRFPPNNMEHFPKTRPGTWCGEFMPVIKPKGNLWIRP